MIYTHVWSCAPVCAPARTTLISGMPANGKVPDPWYSSYVPRLLEDLQAPFK